MTYLALLLALSLTDAIFAGYRAGAGRNARIHKLDYMIVTCWSGFFAGLGAAALAGAATTAYVFLVSGGQPLLAGAIARLDAAAQPLVHAYALFATVLLLVVLFWTYPRRRTRELAVVLILGPCTLLRPYWIIGGALWALAGVELSLAALIALVVGLQLSVEPLLNLWQARTQRLQMQQLLGSAEAPQRR